LFDAERPSPSASSVKSFLVLFSKKNRFLKSPRWAPRGSSHPSRRAAHAPPPRRSARSGKPPPPAHATFGFIGINGGTHLHSHMSAVLPKSRDLGVGALMKHHQYNWALERKIPYISWTFDPLIKKNANFNISKLGVEISAYFQDFYGPMTDLVNAGDASDRLMVKWIVSDVKSQSYVNHLDLPDGAVNISIPDDIVLLRAKNTDKAMAERLRVRDEFLKAFESGYKVIGFSNVHGYILSSFESGNQ